MSESVAVRIVKLKLEVKELEERIQQLEEALEKIQFRSWSNIRDVQGLRRQLKDINNIAVAALSSEAATSEAPEKEEE